MKRAQNQSASCKRLWTIVLSLSFFLSPPNASAQGQQTLVIDVDQPKAQMSQKLWGVFFEDINLGADGGIYAELVKNRSFEFSIPLMGWKRLGDDIPEGSLLILNRKAKNSRNPRFLRVSNKESGTKAFGLRNEGFRGMGIKTGLRYDFSVLYRQQQPGTKLRLELIDTTGKVIGTGELIPEKEDTLWHRQQVSFHASATEEKAQLNIWFEGDGVIDLDMISLFPEDTWRQRPGGLRADMVQLLADMKPSFIRFPGGCIVEGHELSTRYQWKKTVGPIEERELIINRWNNEFAHRLTPDYYQTFGLGFYEYFLMAEDIGAEALPILNCGMACQFNTAELVPIEELDEYIQDALDLIEFANGETSTQWGKLRAEMGHPEPFNLRMLGVGNENWGPQYIERLKIFQKALNQHYPDIQLVASSGTGPDGERFDYLDNELRAMKIDVIDEHYYRSPDWFLKNASRYDEYDRNGPQIFAGEYAAHTKNVGDENNQNSWRAAIAEAAFLTGIERNSDVVTMASYAPLFAHVDGWQWTPDLIWVDNLRAYGTPNYHVQKLYATNAGHAILSIQSDGQIPAGQDSLYASALTNETSNEVIVKVVNHSDKPVNSVLNFKTASKLAKQAEHLILDADNLDQVNSIGQPDAVSPQQGTIALKGKEIRATLAPYSFHVFKIKRN